MSQISDALGSSLSSLSKAIGRAEERLRKLPGAGKAVVTIDEGETDQLIICLEVATNYDGTCQIVVRERDACDSIQLETRLTDLPVVTRIECARRIPDLIDEAVAAESELAAEAEQVAADIDQRLSRLSSTTKFKNLCDSSTEQLRQIAESTVRLFSKGSSPVVPEG